MATYVPKQGEIQRAWWVVDAAGLTLGRLSTVVALRLMGKHKPTYTPFLDTGDHVVVVNAAKVKLTGRKLDDKMYRWHTRLSGRPQGGRRRARCWRGGRSGSWRSAVKGMLPKGPLGRQMVRKLKVYRGSPTPTRRSSRRHSPSRARGAPTARRQSQGSREGATWPRTSCSTTARVDARRPPPACSCVPGRGSIRSTAGAFDGYFPNETLKMMIRQPLVITETADKFDVCRAGGRRRRHGTGRSAPARHRPRPGRATTPSCGRKSQGGRLPDPRSPQGRAQEVRPPGRPQALPVLQAMTRRRRRSLGFGHA